MLRKYARALDIMLIYADLIMTATNYLQRLVLCAYCRLLQGPHVSMLWDDNDQVSRKTMDGIPSERENK